MTETSVVDNEGDLPIWLYYADQTIYKALSQAPYIIASLGHLLLNAAERDFSLSEHQKFDFLKYNNSFRACAAQVSKGVWQSFHTAHISMNQIRMKSENIANNVKKAAEVIEKGTKEEWAIAQTYLKSAETWCIECIETAASVTKAFETVAKMMDELSNACIQSKKENTDEKQKTNLEVDALRIGQGQRKHREEVQKEIFEQEKRKLEKNKTRYDTAVYYSPSPWKIVLFRCFAGVANVSQDLLIQTLPQLLTSQFIPILTSINETEESPSSLDLGPNTTNKNGSGNYQKTTGFSNKLTLDDAEKKQEKEILLEDNRCYQPCYDEIKEKMRVDQRCLEDKCINALDQMTKRWTIIQSMFLEFHDTLNEHLKENVQHFGNAVITVNESHRAGQKTSETTLQVLIRDCKEAQQIAVVVKSISSLYVKVSETYLLEALNRLQRIDPLEPSTDREKMDEIRKELQDNLERARDGISEIAKENKEKLSESVRNLEKILSDDQLEAWYK